jgi:protein-S-isoprenylcysteine O-methyltransferase Ste14
MLGKIKSLVLGFLSMVIYTFIFFIMRTGLKFIPGLFLWSDQNSILNILGVELCFIDMIYFILGMTITTHGFINLFLITKENHKAQNMKTRKPEKLISTGFYSKARHPMYGTFMIINLGLFFSSRSLWGIFIIIIFFAIQYVSTNYEEKNELIKIFGDEYREYKKAVRNKFFTPAYKVYLVISFIITISGIIFLIM